MASRVEWEFSAFESENDDTVFSGVALYLHFVEIVFSTTKMQF